MCCSKVSDIQNRQNWVKNIPKRIVLKRLVILSVSHTLTEN